MPSENYLDARNETDLLQACTQAWEALGEVAETLDHNIAPYQSLFPTVAVAQIKAMVAVMQGVLAAITDSLHRQEYQAGWDSLSPEQQAELEKQFQNLLTLKRG